MGLFTYTFTNDFTYGSGSEQSVVSVQSALDESVSPQHFYTGSLFSVIFKILWYKMFKIIEVENIEFKKSYKIYKIVIILEFLYSFKLTNFMQKINRI